MSTPSLPALLVLRALHLLRTLWLFLEHSLASLQCIAEWWAFELATANRPSLLTQAGARALAPFDDHASASLGLVGSNTSTLRRSDSVLGSNQKVSNSASRIPRHIGLIPACASEDAWGPFSAFRPMWTAAEASGWVPSPERQVVASIVRLATELPAAGFGDKRDGFESVTVLMTGGMRSDVLLSVLHSASSSLTRPLEVVTPRAALDDAAMAAAGPPAALRSRRPSRAAPLRVPLTVYLADPSIHGSSLVAQCARKAGDDPAGDPANISRRVLPDPELVVVGAPACVLQGYPPWGLRVSEIHHERGAPALTPARAMRAVRRWQSVEQRYGK
ncbi:hypothetical protein BC828DRAFT_385996 [Blastocladiella britannica]|nr:hypothetical protein BC828DRAFT_385996 [Blastocladiella britannica]